MIVCEGTARYHAVRIDGQVCANVLATTAHAKGELTCPRAPPNKGDTRKAGIVPLETASMKFSLNGRMGSVVYSNISTGVRYILGDSRALCSRQGLCVKIGLSGQNIGNGSQPCRIGTVHYGGVRRDSHGQGDVYPLVRVDGLVERGNPAN